MNVMRTVFRLSTRLNNAVYTASGGRLMNKAKNGIPVLLLTVKGRKSGTPFTVPVGYLLDEGRYVVVGSAGGQPQEPQWFRNLRATDHAHVLVGNHQRDVAVRVAEGAERDRLFQHVCVQYPAFADYERTSQGRPMPVALLTPH